MHGTEFWGKVATFFIAPNLKGRTGAAGWVRVNTFEGKCEQEVSQASVTSFLG